MRVDGRLIRVGGFPKLDRYKEHDIEVVVCDLKSQTTGRKANVGGRKRQHPALDTRPSSIDSQSEALTRALQLGKGSCFLLSSDGEILSWFSTTRTDRTTGESFPELDPKHFSFNSPRGLVPRLPRPWTDLSTGCWIPREDEESAARNRRPGPRERCRKRRLGHALPRLSRRAAQPRRPRGQTALPDRAAALAARAAAACRPPASWPAFASSPSMPAGGRSRWTSFHRSRSA